MYREEVNERSPMRVFERSLRGGLGRCHIGVAAAGPGIGKTPFLVQIALDNLLRDRRVLHISHEHAVDHVRTFYMELFQDLAQICRLEQPELVELELERHRLIFSLLTHASEGPPSSRGGRSSVTRILEVVRFAEEVNHFRPDVLIIDGFDLIHGSKDALTALAGLAKERELELWIACQTERLSVDRGRLPAPLDRFAEWLDVVVFLQPDEQGTVRLCLLKDHDNAELSPLTLRLDPTTMRITEEDLPPPVARPSIPHRFHLVSGGARGAEAEFGACAERWGLRETNYSFDGHRFCERQRGVEVLGPEELGRGDFSLVFVSRHLHRKLDNIPTVRKILQTIWYQIIQARQVFVVGYIQEDGTVRGGTGWGAELARLWKKPLYVFDQDQNAWRHWNGRSWEPITRPAITAETFAGIGTQRLSDEGRAAIQDLFRRSFGEAPAA